MRKMVVGLVLTVASAFAWAGAGNKAVRADQSVVPEKGGIQIDEENFPDSEFRAYVLDTIDLNRNKILDQREIETTNEINIFSTEIESLKGVEYFSNLAQLQCIGVDMTDLSDKRGALTDLDVSKNTNLTVLICYGNQLKNLDLSQNLKLEWVECYLNKLRSLDVSKNTKLNTLDCSCNSIKKLDLGNQKNLQNLLCQENQITSLNLDGCPGLQWLECGDNELTSLEIGKCPDLGHFVCASNQLTELDVSNNVHIWDLDCSSNEISKLDVSKLKELEHLECEANRLTELDVSNNNALANLMCGENLISELDLSRNTKLCNLYCADNNLSVLNLKDCPDFHFLNCSGNKLKTLNIETLKGLQEFQCRDCDLTKLDVSAFPNLYYLDCSSNALTKLDLSANQNIRLLFTHYNQLEKLDVSACGAICGQLEDPDCRRITMWGKKEREYFAYLVGEDGLFLSLDIGTELVTPSLSSSFEEFVERLYSVALNRSSDPEGKAFWVKQVVEEGKTGADCARFFLLDAPEFMKRNLPVEDFVETLYATFFDRKSDAAGKKGWVDAINSGAKTRAEVVNDFIESTEWCNVCATYGVKSGAKWHKATNPSENALKFATRLYTCCLQRDPEQDGLQYWALALTNLEKTGAEAAQFFFEGEEFIGFKTSDYEYLTRLYTTFMDRDPSSDEIYYWVGEMISGKQTRQSVLAFFAQSKEFTNLCKQYGIERGEI